MDGADDHTGEMAELVESVFPAHELTGPEDPPDVDFVVTKEHRRFTEFADAVRRDHYIGLCYGPPGVGKTISARHYASWSELEPLLRRSRHHFTEGRDRTDWHTLLYTPTVSATPRMIDKELTQMAGDFVAIRTPDPFDRRTYSSPHVIPSFVELLVID
ncbi:MAG: hypothetical protein ACR2MP_16050, partial [Streptosporangiaceae bacterium]